jgi:two-component system chemotaxis sensor kinase CheA
VGLDVVRETASRLGGEVAVETRAGEGTTVELEMPVSLSALEALMVEAAGRTAGIPLEAVKRAVRFGADEVVRGAHGAAQLVHDGRTVPFAPLGALLGGRDVPPSPASWTAVIVASGDRIAGVGVDRLLGTASLLVRPVPALAPVHALVAGTCLDSDGNPQLVLDASELVAAAHAVDPRARPPEPARKAPVLVVDDSLTTRMLEQSILESAGFEVEVAVSGEEALDKASKRAFGLFLVDVEMPGMDGFTFVERTRTDPALRDVPSILVTSRSSPEDRRRGEEVGARAYVVKSEFDQAALLETIRRLAR